MNDDVKHPMHYTKHSVEIIDITRFLPFCLGNVVKYVMRAPYKDGAKDCDKALQYLEWHDARPLQMRLFAGESFRKNLINLRTELEAENISVSMCQAEFLIILWNSVCFGQYVNDMKSVIQNLRELLEEKEDGN